MNLLQWADWLGKKVVESQDGTFYVYNDDALRMAREMRIHGKILQTIRDSGFDLSPCGKEAQG